MFLHTVYCPKLQLRDARWVSTKTKLFQGCGGENNNFAVLRDHDINSRQKSSEILAALSALIKSAQFCLVSSSNQMEHWLPDFFKSWQMLLIGIHPKTSNLHAIKCSFHELPSRSRCSRVGQSVIKGLVIANCDSSLKIRHHRRKVRGEINDKRGEKCSKSQGLYWWDAEPQWKMTEMCVLHLHFFFFSHCYYPGVFTKLWRKVIQSFWIPGLLKKKPHILINQYLYSHFLMVVKLPVFSSRLYPDLCFSGEGGKLFSLRCLQDLVDHVGVLNQWFCFCFSET